MAVRELLRLAVSLHREPRAIAAAVEYEATLAPEGVLRSRPGVVWTLDGQGVPRSTWITLGITDGSFTEVLDGDLREGQQVIVAAAARSGASNPLRPAAAPRLRSLGTR